MSELPVYIYNREFDASLAKVWKTWTDPKLLAVWYGPGVETIIHKFDLQPGESWLIEMKFGEKSDFSRMDFSEVNGKSKIQLQQVPVDASEAEIACFTEMMSNMDHGWGSGFDIFEKLLKESA